MATIRSQFETLLPSARDLKSVGWPDWLIDDYLALVRQIVLVSETEDDFTEIIDQIISDISDLTNRVNANEIEIQNNAEDIENLEYRVFGDDRPSIYLESGQSYVVGSYVVSPTNDPQKYYRARVNISDPAGTFDSTLWQEVTLQGLVQEVINLEYRAYGNVPPSVYDQSAGYLTGDKVLNPFGEPNNYYRAKEDIAAPAGAFNSALWQEMSISANSDQIEDIRSNYRRDYPNASLFGDASNFAFNLTPSKLVNFTDSDTWGVGVSSSNVDPVNGEIDIPEDGLWQVNVFLGGTQGSTTFDESMILELDINATRKTISVLDIASSSTNQRTFSASITLRLLENDTLSIYCTATAALGTFTVNDAMLQIKKLSD